MAPAPHVPQVALALSFVFVFLLWYCMLGLCLSVSSVIIVSSLMDCFASSF